MKKHCKNTGFRHQKRRGVGFLFGGCEEAREAKSLGATRGTCELLALFQTTDICSLRSLDSCDLLHLHRRSKIGVCLVVEKEHVAQG